MKNIQTTVTGDTLTITCKLSVDFGRSKSGKSTIIASSEGNIAIPIPGGDVKLGLNLYK